MNWLLAGMIDAHYRSKSTYPELRRPSTMNPPRTPKRARPGSSTRRVSTTRYTQ